MKRNVVIWGVDDYNVLGIYRQLRDIYDITFIVFQGVKHCASLSKYCTKLVELSTLNEGLDYLLSNFNDEYNKAVIINSNDLIAEFLDLHRAELSKYFVVPGTSSAGLLKKIDNKVTMTAIAKELGFDVPESMACNSETNFQNVSYPCLLKPTNQTLGRYNEFKFKICENAKQLKRTMRYVRKDSTFILQQYIPKESVALVYGCRTLDGKVNLAGVLLKDRFCDNGDGSHGVLISNLPAYIKADLIEKFMANVDFYGLFSVEYLVHKGTAYFIEVNWRNDGTSHLFYQAGANMPLLWVKSSLGEDFKDVSVKVSPQSFFIDEIFDEENVNKNVVSRDQWQREREIATVFKYYDPEDMVPFEAVKKGKKKKLLLDSIVAKNRLYIVYILDKLGIRRK